MRPSDVGIADADTLDAFTCSRDRYLSTSLLWNVGGPKAGEEVARRKLEV